MSRLPGEIVALAIIFGAATFSVAAVTVVSPMPRLASNLPTVGPVGARGAGAGISGALAGPLDGELTARSLATRRPIAVMVDNFYPDARPESGVSKASIVFEAVTEGGITRLLAIFLEHDATTVGPVRSARPYFVQWAAGYGSMFVHDGGSPASLRMLSASSTLADVQAQVPSRSFFRTPDRRAPHNLYASTLAVRALAIRNGWRTRSDVVPIPHIQSSRTEARGRGKRFTVDFPTPTTASPPRYLVHYRYDPARNVYVRAVGGAPAIDGLTHRVIVTANVAVLFTSIKPIPGDPLGRVDVAAVGAGRAYYFHDGRVFHGRWRKASSAAPLQFLSANGTPERFEPGSIWVEVVTAGGVRFGR